MQLFGAEHPVRADQREKDDVVYKVGGKFPYKAVHCFELLAIPRPPAALFAALLPF
jgi:hypothetical protein